MYCSRRSVNHAASETQLGYTSFSPPPSAAVQHDYVTVDLGDVRPSVTSTNVAETGGDVTDHTLIDNDLYERPGQGQGQPSSGFTGAAASGPPVYIDASTTLVDNPLYTN